MHLSGRSVGGGEQADGAAVGAEAVAAVPEIIDGLRKRGYSFLTVGELLDI